jgi:hypothetical protein
VEDPSVEERVKAEEGTFEEDAQLCSGIQPLLSLGISMGASAAERPLELSKKALRVNLPGRMWTNVVMRDDVPFELETGTAVEAATSKSLETTVEVPPLTYA